MPISVRPICVELAESSVCWHTEQRFVLVVVMFPPKVMASGRGKLTAGREGSPGVSARPPPPLVLGCAAPIHQAVAACAEQQAVLGACPSMVAVKLRVEVHAARRFADGGH